MKSTPAKIRLGRKNAAKNPRVRWDALNEFLADADPASLSPTQRVAYLAYWYSSHVMMGGHHDYFSACSQWDHSEVASALRTVGAHEQSSILDSALAAVQAATVRAPAEYSNRFVAGVEFADFTEFDDTFDNCARAVPECLLDYIAKQEEEFIEWKA